MGGAPRRCAVVAWWQHMQVLYDNHWHRTAGNGKDWHKPGTMGCAGTMAKRGYLGSTRMPIPSVLSFWARRTALGKARSGTWYEC